MKNLILPLVAYTAMALSGEAHAAGGTSKSASSGNVSKVQKAYEKVLGRKADAEGQKYWASELAKGVSEKEMIARMSDSPEAKNKASTSKPAVARNSGGGGTSKGATGEVSKESTAKVKAALEEIAVENAYRTVFGREPDAAGKAFWTNELANGMTVKEMNARMKDSPEKKEKRAQVVDDIYAKFFGREADAAGKEFWVNEMNHGMSKAEVLARMKDSTEYKEKMARDAVIQNKCVGGDFEACLQLENIKNGVAINTKSVKLDGVPYGTYVKWEDNVRLAVYDAAGNLLTQLAISTDLKTLIDSYDVDPESYLTAYRASGASKSEVQQAEKTIKEHLRNPFLAEADKYLAKSEDFLGANGYIRPGTGLYHTNYWGTNGRKVYYPDLQAKYGYTQAETTEMLAGNTLPLNWDAILASDDPLKAFRAGKSAYYNDPQWQKVNSAWHDYGKYPVDSERRASISTAGIVIDTKFGEPSEQEKLAQTEIDTGADNVGDQNVVINNFPEVGAAGQANNLTGSSYMPGARMPASR